MGTGKNGDPKIPGEKFSLTGQAVEPPQRLRRQLGHLGVRVTQATLPRYMRELRLVKTVEGYRPLSTATTDEVSPP